MGPPVTGSGYRKFLHSSGKEEDSGRRRALRRIGALTGMSLVGGASALLGGCGSGGGDGPVNPLLGSHDLAFYVNGAGLDPVSVQLGTQSSGSTILASIGRGLIAQHVPPTDNRGNTYALLEGPHNYPILWPNSGTALYADASAMGGGAHTLSAANPNSDEITLAAVEIRNAGIIQDVKWNYPTAAPLTSLSVTTTGPATLVAFWWGDGAVSPTGHTAIPDSGFTVVDSLLTNQAIVQCAVAVRNVTAAGQYNVTWTATPAQGAQLYLVAVQKA